MGKYAEGTTRIVVTGQHHEGQYILKVQDNGAGLKPAKGQQGTKQGKVLDYGDNFDDNLCPKEE